MGKEGLPHTREDLSSDPQQSHKNLGVGTHTHICKPSTLRGGEDRRISGASLLLAYLQVQ